MVVQTCATPPDARTNYIVDQFEGERITIPGSKGVFRMLASSKQTNGSMAIFTSGSVIADAPGFHWHEEAHDVFLVTKGFLKLWAGEKCRILGPGDFAYVPPKVIHNPEQLGPHTELLGLVAPGDWVDFFRYVGETYEGVLVPEHDDRDLKHALISKLMAAKDRFDVHFSRDYQPPEVGEWLAEENVLGKTGEAYFLRANTGPRWALGGVMSRPFILSSQTGGRFSISSIESSKAYTRSPLSRWLNFAEVDHCFVVKEGVFSVKIKGDDEWNDVREGQTIVIAAGETFMIRFSSTFVRVWSCANGKGIEEVIQRAGKQYEGYVIPDTAKVCDEDQIAQICRDIGASSSAD
jgi:mannose-6-phosphate isomerase-like protein (cupin superfamily)